MSGMVKSGVRAMALLIGREDLLGRLRDRGRLPEGKKWDATASFLGAVADIVERDIDEDLFQPVHVVNMLTLLLNQAKGTDNMVPTLLRIPTMAAYVFDDKFAIEFIKRWEEVLPDPG